jgi:hypothetical protein
MSATALLLATRSPGKIREITPMFAAAGLTLVSLDELGIDDSPEEDEVECYDTFEANALAKARYFFEVSGGIPTVADDSGLEVDVLGGQPGVASKRWSGRTDLRGATHWSLRSMATITLQPATYASPHMWPLVWSSRPAVKRPGRSCPARVVPVDSATTRTSSRPSSVERSERQPRQRRRQ